jgi:riboflavin synthase
MFTGLVAGLGEVVAFEQRSDGSAELEIAAPALAPHLAIGDSIAVNGACLTARDVTPTSFRADVVAETLRRTTLGELAVGAGVNLELPLRASDRLGGHVVLGHIDGVATVRAVHDDGAVDIELEAPLTRYVVEKGSIALNGVSLTVAALAGSLLTVALIPATRDSTTLGELAVGSRLNVEVDILAKHVEKLVAV